MMTEDEEEVLKEDMIQDLADLVENWSYDELVAFAKETISDEYEMMDFEDVQKEHKLFVLGETDVVIEEGTDE